MRQDVRLDIFGRIDTPEVLNLIAEAALETCEDARFAVSDNPEVEDMVSVVTYIDELAADNAVLTLSIEDTRNEFEDIRSELRANDVAYRFMRGTYADTDFAESSIWRPGWDDERTVEIKGKNNPVISLEDVEIAHTRGPFSVQSLINSTRSAAILQENDSIMLSANLAEQWRKEFGYEPREASII